MFLPDMALALLILGFCGFSRWFYIVTVPCAFVMLAIFCFLLPPVFFLDWIIYELILTAVVAVVYFTMRSRALLDRFCLAAIVSAACAILNPAVIAILLRKESLLHVFFGSYTPFRSFEIGSLAIIAGHIALVRIKNSGNLLPGRLVARVGLIIDYLWLCCWLFLFFAFQEGRSLWH